MNTQQAFIKKKQELDELPVFRITYDPNSENQGIEFISLVADPAIDIKGQYFGKEKKMEFKAIKEQMMIVGPFMRPNYKILRTDGDYQYYVFFDEQTIRSMQQNFNRNAKPQMQLNVDHSGQIVDGFIDQNWIVEDSKYDKSKLWGYELEIGSWFGMVKIDDAEFWEQEVKDLGKYSFSIEGHMGTTPYQMVKQYMETDEFSKLLLDIKSKLNSLGELSDDEYYEIYSSATGTGYRIGYDFDGVLSTPQGQAMAAKDIKNGNQVFVCTKRGLMSQNDVYAVSDRLGIPRENVIFTQGKYKYNYLRNLFIDIFYDDTQEEIDKINRHSGVVGKIFRIK